jgi:ABC-2 type transport system permease protein
VIADLTPWAWTANHLPLAGEYDWASLIPVAVVAAILLGAGVEVFARRDLGVTIAIPTPRLPVTTAGLGGPVRRSFGDRLPVALAWGLGIGLFGLVMAAISRSIADEVARAPDLARTFRQLFPTIDITSAGGFLELLVQLLTIVVGFAAATLVAGWAADETSGRLEMLLSTPLRRAGWVIRAGLGVLAAIAVMTVVMAVLIGLGAAAAGSDALTPMAGTIPVGLYAAALAGIGFAVGGIVRTSIAAEAVAVVVVGTYLIDLLAPALRLPDTVHQLALTAHLGQPMVGIWDPAGIVACLVIAFGGLLLGGWGMRRRDVNG